VAGQPGVTPQGAGRLRLGSTAAALALGSLVLVLVAAAVPLSRLAHQSLNAANGSVPVWARYDADRIAAAFAARLQDAVDWTQCGPTWPVPCSRRWSLPTSRCGSRQPNGTDLVPGAPATYGPARTDQRLCWCRPARDEDLRGGR
jgi:hypothetical protein